MRAVSCVRAPSPDRSASRACGIELAACGASASCSALAAPVVRDAARSWAAAWSCAVFRWRDAGIEHCSTCSKANVSRETFAALSAVRAGCAGWGDTLPVSRCRADWNGALLVRRSADWNGASPARRSAGWGEALPARHSAGWGKASPARRSSDRVRPFPSTPFSGSSFVGMALRSDVPKGLGVLSRPGDPPSPGATFCPRAAPQGEGTSLCGAGRRS